MAWIPFYIKETPTIGAGSTAKVSDTLFPFATNTIYKNLNVWVTTAANASYAVTTAINDSTQDTITIQNQKTVCNYSSPHLFVKDLNFKFDVKVTNNGPSANFQIMITGEYFV